MTDQQIVCLKIAVDLFHEVGSVDGNRLAFRVDLFHEVGSVARDRLASRVDNT